MPTPMRYQPQGAIRVRSELTTGGRGIGFVLGQTRSDIFGGRPEIAYFGAPAQVGNTQGYARKFVAASSTYARVTPTAGTIDLTGNFFVVVAFTPDLVTTAGYRIAHFSDTVAGLNFQLVQISKKLCFVLGTGSNQGATATSSAELLQGAPYVAVMGRGPDGFFLYLDGAPQVLGSNGTGGIANNIVSADINLARRGDNASYWNGQISLFAYGQGRVDPAALSSNPWLLFEEDDDERAATLAASPQSYTLTAAAGTFDLSGAAVGLCAARRLATEPAAFALAGAGAAIRTVRKITPCAGSLSLTGSDATLTASRRLSAASGSFTIVGQAATLVHTAAPAPDGPTYVVTAASGSFALSAAPTALVASRRMATDAGSFSVAAAPARFAALRRMSAASGQIDVAGAAVLLLTDRRLQAAAGVFTVAGGDIAFRHSAQVEYARAPAGSGYAPRRHEYQSRPAQISTGGRPPATQENYR